MNSGSRDVTLTRQGLSFRGMFSPSETISLSITKQKHFPLEHFRKHSFSNVTGHRRKRVDETVGVYIYAFCLDVFSGLDGRVQTH